MREREYRPQYSSSIHILWPLDPPEVEKTTDLLHLWPESLLVSSLARWRLEEEVAFPIQSQQHHNGPILCGVFDRSKLQQTNINMMSTPPCSRWWISLAGHLKLNKTSPKQSICANTIFHGFMHVAPPSPLLPHSRLPSRWLLPLLPTGLSAGRS